MKVACEITMTREKEILQSDLNRLIYWVNEWQKEFNIGKCKVLHIESHNDRVYYLRQWFPNFFSLLPNLTCHMRRATPFTKCCQY